MAKSINELTKEQAAEARRRLQASLGAMTEEQAVEAALAQEANDAEVKKSKKEQKEPEPK